MIKSENDNPKGVSSEKTPSLKNKQKNQGKKRKRSTTSESSNDDIILPDNALETERNVHASAVKNNLDETSVRKIIKRVVTNDHVLALVKLREEEDDSSTDDKKLVPKLTRAKVKELKKVAPACKTAAWDLENLELTPIKHIPVKTRPEVKALIAQELPEDEDDEEYEPTHDEVPSDDDHVESCSDLDSQPRTPVTPASLVSDSPRVVKDGPFKVPQEVSSARRKLDIEEEATIALRTRSKLSLSSTSIEHIESTFVPPDDIPLQDVDDLWNQFLNECLNPASATKNEDDDETDPEYNVAADPDAHDEDEEALGNSLIKISKKELNDLVTELFSILPENAEVDLAENLASSVLTDSSQTEISQWETKQEPVSDDENGEKPSRRLTFEKKEYSRTSVETENGERERKSVQSEKETSKVTVPNFQVAKKPPVPHFKIISKNKKIEISIEERNEPTASDTQQAPPSLRPKIKPVSETVHIQIESTVTMTPEQVLILQQQFRQHIQLATSNFMQLVVHPIHWKLAPTYKDYLTSLTKLVEKNEKSIVNVCNLKPAFELITTWEKSVTEDTPENRKMIEFVQNQVDRSRRRMASNSIYAGDFHVTFKKVIANSPVFLYPYLLPAMPYRPDEVRRFCYLHSEETLIVLGLDQFWQYVESNPQLFKLYRVPVPNARRGLMATVELVTKHMFPWMTTKRLAGHIQAVRAAADKHNPIHRYFKYNEVPKTEHKLLPFNPSITMYEQPEHEMPRLWARYLAKTSKRFRNYILKRPHATGRQPDGVPIKSGLAIDTTIKKPLPIDFTKEIIQPRSTLHEKPPPPNLADKFDLHVERIENATVNSTDKGQNPMAGGGNLYKLVETSTGAYLVPCQVFTQSANSTMGSIKTPDEIRTILPNNLPETSYKKLLIDTEHCTCCVLLRKICKQKQSLITDYFGCKSGDELKKCSCNNRSYPKISKRLKLLVRNHKRMSELVFKDLEKKLHSVASGDFNSDTLDLSSKDVAHVLTYQLKLFTQASMSHRIYVKKRVSNLLSRFNLESGDAIKLAMDLFKTFDTELMDLYLDFLSFLTPEQVDKIDVFRDYFTRNCAKDLMELIEKEVQTKEVRNKMLFQLKSLFTARFSSSCEMCSSLLDTMQGYPTLARYTFELFPHRKETRTQSCTQLDTAESATSQNEVDDTIFDTPHNTVDYEADHSSCGEDSDTASEPSMEPADKNNVDNKVIKTEPPSEDQNQTAKSLLNKVEEEEYHSDTSMTILESGGIKEEKPDWNRDEDKLVLLVLQEHLTREERNGESILDLIEAKKVYELLSESLPDKSLAQIQERVIYLLTVLVKNENGNVR